ncbi:TPA: hypothetical protein ACFP4Q_001638 [Neisseria weaveri]|uniref:hypothetical protein n=1 Tax=Neisseria sp. 74A18 TaxID=1696094 RepID=UPI0006CAC805|nr:hypothetical protein [Neisseria sp. 74A18]KPN72994.1 hypothetical protein AKG43_10205 [Neisseria sp. 74A18]
MKNWLMIILSLLSLGAHSNGKLTIPDLEKTDLILQKISKETQLPQDRLNISWAENGTAIVSFIHNIEDIETRGLIDFDGKWLLTPTDMVIREYKHLSYFFYYSKLHNLIIKTERTVNGKTCYGILDLKGRELFSPQFASISVEDDDLPLIEVEDCQTGKIHRVSLPNSESK